MAFVHKEFARLYYVIEDMDERSFPSFLIIKEIFVEDVPNIWGTRDKEKTINEENDKRASKRRKRERER